MMKLPAERPPATIFSNDTWRTGRISEDDTVKLWSIVSGTVEKVTLHAIIVNVDVKGLSVVIKSVLKPGYMFEDILVLDFVSKWKN
ncbi:hypothetical protein L2E82_11952 [Cichorium intybus]|uniref:Uncharacterized protein n=1 Tax=Cichorium intybus TaxID=13427 RepID=A0ACB9GEQ6_CICIN|nr:hypothetical protein L2E82_11952 [Cichorium intybus]